MLRTLALAVSLAFVAAASGRAQDPAACAPALADRVYTGRAAQLVTVVAATARSTRGTVRLWARSGGCWRPAGGPWTAWLGARGVSADRREGDRTTPAGTFPFGATMYGNAANPGVRYPYRRIVCGDWWVEDARSPYYNRFRHVRCGAKPPFRITSEDMSRSPTAYRHLAVIGFNANPVVRGRGSGIFLHVSTGGPTLGCVSLPLAHLVATLRWLRPASNPLIAIGTRADLASVTPPEPSK